MMIQENPPAIDESTLHPKDRSIPDEQLVDFFSQPEVQEAAAHFEKMLPTVKAMARQLKAGSLQRVFCAAMEFPFGEAYPKFRKDTEQQLFGITLSLMMAKNKIMGAVAADQAQTKRISEQMINNASSAVAADATPVADASIASSTGEAQGENDGSNSNNITES